MKKKSIFISIVLALVMCLASLVACGEDVDNAGGDDDPPEPGQTTPEPTPEPAAAYDAAAVLEKLQGALAVDATLYAKAVDTADSSIASETTTETDAYISSDEYYVATKYDENTKVVGHYFKNAAGNVSTRTVDKANVLKETEVQFKNADKTTSPHEFSKIYVNPFSFVTTDKMTQNDKEVVIDADVPVGAITFGEALDSMFATMSDKARDIVIKLDDDFKPVSFEFTVEVKGKKVRRKTYDYTYKYKGNLVEKAALNVPEYPCPAKGDKALLKTALDKMAANNFSFVKYSAAYKDGKEAVMNGVVTPECAWSTSSVAAFGYLNDPKSGNLVEVDLTEDKDGKKILKGNGNEWEGETLASMKLPKGGFSVDVFRQIDDNKYALIPGDYAIGDLIPDGMFELMSMSSDIVFTINENPFTVTYTYKAPVFLSSNLNTITVTLSDFGTAKLGYNLATDYIEYSVTKWSDISEEFDYQCIFGSEANIDNDIPFFETAKGRFTKFQDMFSEYSTDITKYTADEVTAYKAKLVAAGWTEETETDAFGGENKFYVNAAKTIKLTLTDNFGASLTLGLSVYTAPSAQA